MQDEKAAAIPLVRKEATFIFCQVARSERTINAILVSDCMMTSIRWEEIVPRKEVPAMRPAIFDTSSDRGWERLDRGGFVEGGAVHLGCDGVALEEFGGKFGHEELSGRVGLGLGGSQLFSRPSGRITGIRS